MELLQNQKLVKSAVAVLFVLAAFLAVKTVNEIKMYNFIGGGVPVSNTITVQGEGEAFAVADIATFSFSVIEESDTVAVAQESATKKMNTALALLRDSGIAEKDIKTTGYNIYPKYEYTQEICTAFRCPPGKSELTGYEVSHSVSVKVRDTKMAGAILAKIGSSGASNVSGLDFTIDDEDAISREARKEAIDDARSKAQELAKDLGVRLVRVVSFNESGASPYYYKLGVAEAGFDGGFGGALPVDLPTGENKITSQVSITYEIR